MAQPREDPLSLMERVHRGADIQAHGEILLGGLRVAERPFLPLYLECLRATETRPLSWKILRRAQRAYHVARYVERVVPPGGAMVECGVFQGFSALLACRVRQAVEPGFKGRGLHLVDSFEGLSAPGDEDLIQVMDRDGRVARRPSHERGFFAVDLPTVRARFGDFPDVAFVKGWIPESLAQLPEQRWSFVHIDVDLYEPTRGCLEYFYPRMAPGGVILNDDFASPLFPGGGKAWVEFFDKVAAPYVVLDTGQSAYMRPASPAA